MSITSKSLNTTIKEKQINIRCRTCAKQLTVNQNLRIQIVDQYHFKLGINIIIFNDPKLKNNSQNSKQLNNFVGFCKNCYENGYFYNTFNDVHYDYYMQEKQTQRHFLQQADNQVILLKNKIDSLTITNDYLRQKNSEYETSLKKITAQIKMEIKINELKAKIDALEQKIKNYVQASQKMLTQSQQSVIAKKYQFCLNKEQEIMQSINVCDKTIYELCHSLSQIVNNYSDYEIQLHNSQDKNQIFSQDGQKIIQKQIQEQQRSIQISLKKLQKYFESELKSLCYELQQEQKQIQKNKKKHYDHLASLKQHFQIFAISLQCSSCSRMLFIDKLNYKKVGKNYFKLQLNFCIFNSSFKDQKGKEYDLFNTFEVYCQDCYKKGKYFTAFREKHKVCNFQIIKTHEFKSQLNQKRISFNKQKQKLIQQEIMIIDQPQHMWSLNQNLNQWIIKAKQKMEKQQQNLKLNQLTFQTQNNKNNLSYSTQYQQIKEKETYYDQQFWNIQQPETNINKKDTKNAEIKKQFIKAQQKKKKNKQTKRQDIKETKLQKLKNNTKRFITYLVQKNIWHMRQSFNIQLFNTLQASQYYQIIDQICSSLVSESSVRDFILQIVQTIDGAQAYFQQVATVSLLSKVIKQLPTFFENDQKVIRILLQACGRNWVPTDDPCDYWDRLMHLRPEDDPQFPQLSVRDIKNKNNLKIIYNNSGYF